MKLGYFIIPVLFPKYLLVSKGYVQVPESKSNAVFNHHVHQIEPRAEVDALSCKGILAYFIGIDFVNLKKELILITFEGVRYSANVGQDISNKVFFGAEGKSFVKQVKG